MSIENSILNDDEREKKKQSAVHAFQCFYSGQCIKYKIVLHTRSVQWTKPIKSFLLPIQLVSFVGGWLCRVLTDHFFRRHWWGLTECWSWKKNSNSVACTTIQCRVCIVWSHFVFGYFHPFFSQWMHVHVHSMEKRMNVSLAANERAPIPTNGIQNKVPIKCFEKTKLNKNKLIIAKLWTLQLLLLLRCQTDPHEV